MDLMENLLERQLNEQVYSSGDCASPNEGTT